MVVGRSNECWVTLGTGLGSIAGHLSFIRDYMDGPLVEWCDTQVFQITATNVLIQHSMAAAEGMARCAYYHWPGTCEHEYHPTL